MWEDAQALHMRHYWRMIIPMQSTLDLVVVSAFLRDTQPNSKPMHTSTHAMHNFVVPS